MKISDYLDLSGVDGVKRIASDRVRTVKPEKVTFHGKTYYDKTPFFMMDSSKIVMEVKPEETPERRKEIKRREMERYRIRTWEG